MSELTGLRWRSLPLQIDIRPQIDLASCSDDELIAGVAASDPAALAEIVNRYGSILAAVATRAVGAEAGQDVVQDVLTRLWQNPARFDATRAPLRAYLILQVRSRALDVRRTDTARRAREVRDESSSGRRSQSNGLDELYSYETLGALMAELGDEEREPIFLAFFDGYTYREVAAKLGLPEGTVKSRIRSGLQRLRTGLPTDHSVAD